MSNKKCFVLMEIGWQYNDEVYFRLDESAGRPRKVFLSQEDAEKEVLELNFDNFKELIRSGDLVNYDYDMMNIITEYAEEKVGEDTRIDILFEKFFNINFDQWLGQSYNSRRGLHPSQPSEDVTPEDWVELMKCFNLEFWEIVPVEVG
jgi:hypothetical protein